MVADVLPVLVKGVSQGDPLGIGRRHVQIDQPAARGGKFCLLAMGALGGDEGIGAGGLAAARTQAQPFEIVTAFGVDFVFPADFDVIATHPALAVETCGRKFSGVADLYFLEEFYSADFRHCGRLRRFLVRTATRIAHKGPKFKMNMVASDRAAF
jgi:hypothetical protein